MKKIFICLILTTLIFLNSNSKAFATSPPAVVADGALLVDASTGIILYEKNKNKTFYPASTTKIMTALLVLEKCKLTDKVIIGKTPSSFVDGNKIYLFENEEFTVDQLLHALLIASANDVAIAFAEHISGSEQAFANLMNERAKQLGCLNTHFVNSHGLFDPDHYTTANDLYLIAREAMKNDTFRQLINIKAYMMPPTNKQPKERPLSSNNMLILNTKYHIDQANGIKVGYTTESGHSFVGSAYSGDMKLIVVLLQDKKPGLWEDASSLLKYGMTSFKTFKKVSEGEKVSSIKIQNSDIEIPLVAENDFYYTYPSDDAPVFSSNLIINNNHNGYILKGQNLGFIEYLANGLKIASVPVKANCALPATFFYSYKNTSDGTLKKSYKPWFIIPILCFFILFLYSKFCIARKKRRRTR